MNFALFFASRGFLPGERIAGTIKDYQKVLKENGYKYLLMPSGNKRYDSVETIEKGQIYADFPYTHRGEYDGAIGVRTAALKTIRYDGRGYQARNEALYREEVR